MAKNNKSHPIPTIDQDQRDLILRALDKNILVEAAAGTGKTTCMVGRMVALLREGSTKGISHLAAVTFTRKAAAELRTRFQVALERAARESEEEARLRLQTALLEVDRCFIGTIHAFCARLLRERPVEAGVDPAFEEMDEEDDRRFRREAWQRFTARLLTEDDRGLLAALDECGLTLKELESTFLDFADYPDVDRWPVPEDRALPDLDKARDALLDYAKHMQRLAGRLPEDTGTDTLIPKIRLLSRLIRHTRDLDRPARLMEVFQLFTKAKATLKCWGPDKSDKDRARAEQERWTRFREEVALPCVTAWHHYRYPVVIEALLEAREVYDALRSRAGVLNYQDLLMKAAQLLKNQPHVRTYFQERYTHLLVDEFQDTDPLQAQIMLLLTATDPTEQDWRRCRPRAGALFVVGDPKQSIYRFRRADIVTYNRVKEIIEGCDEPFGLVLSLRANFRTTKPLITWINEVFGPTGNADGENSPRFPAEPTEASPAYVPLLPTRQEGCAGALRGISVLRLLGDLGNKASVVDHEAGLIARFIRHALDEEWPVSRTENELAAGRSPKAEPSDFMIITYKTQPLSVYAEKLEALKVPCQVTGGTTLNQVPELHLLLLALKAVVQPDNPVALIAALRSGLFGVSDPELYAFKQQGGTFDYTAAPPKKSGEAMKDAFERLKKYGQWLSAMPPVASMDRMVEDLGLGARAAAGPGGEVRAGSLAKALEILRALEDEMGSAAHLVDHLGQLVRGEEKHDGISARSKERPYVRIMNLHKAKGLEAPVVFLAAPYGKSEHDVKLHIDRERSEVLGFMAVHGSAPEGRSAPCLALPPDWESHTRVEKAFQDAENLRLLYVAATRAGSHLVVSRREGAPGKLRYNPWGHFAPHLESCEALPVPNPGGISEAKPESARLSAQRVDCAMGRMKRALAQVMKPTYGSMPAKEFAFSMEADSGPASRPEAPAPLDVDALNDPEGEHGVEWGTVIHALLQLAMASPKADLFPAAEAQLAENGLDETMADAAVETVQRVRASRLWKRARKSELYLTEVPFQVSLEEKGREPDAGPLVLRGVVDLAFREAGAWVIVDYKTDTGRGQRAEKYERQVRLYADAWAKCTGEPVKERGLFFIRTGNYRMVLSS